MLRTRTIREAALHFKKLDPQTGLTETAIRTLVRSGKIPSVKIGKKYLISLETLEAYLSGTTEMSATLDNHSRKDWRID